MESSYESHNASDRWRDINGIRLFHNQYELRKTSLVNYSLYMRMY